jgi:hypothetical protein
MMFHLTPTTRRRKLLFLVTPYVLHVTIEPRIFMLHQPFLVSLAVDRTEAD